MKDTQEPAVACRKCGRPINLSPASGLWWATDEVLFPACLHEPNDSEGGGGDD